MPESIRNAIVLAMIAVLVAVMSVGLLAWTRRPAAPPPRAAQGLPLLVNDRDGGVYDLNLKLRQMERRLGESQVASQRLIEQLTSANEERGRFLDRLVGLEKEVRSLRKRVQEAEKRLPPPAVRTQPAVPPASAPATSPPVTTSTPGGETPAVPPP